MAEKPNCYECRHRRTLPGDAHSRCAHPALGPLPTNEIAGMVAALQGTYAAAPVTLGVTGDPTGIRRGWFLWPANFDPTWLRTCNGFTAREPQP